MKTTSAYIVTVYVYGSEREIHMPDFFDTPVFDSPYETPTRHWKLDETGQPTACMPSVRESGSWCPITTEKG